MKKIFSNYFILLVMVLSIITVNIPMPISDNGILNIALVELLFPLIIFLLFIVFLRKKGKMPYSKIRNSIIIFLVYYLIIFLIRYFLHMEFKQSLLTIKVTIFPIAIIYACYYLKIPKKSIIKCLILFNFIINAIQLVNYSNLRMSMFLGNVVVYLTLIESLYFINISVLFEKEYSIFLKVLSFFNIFITITVPLIIGSRSSFYIISAISIALLLFYLYKKYFKRFLTLIILLIVSIFANYYCWNVRYIESFANRILPQVFKVTDSHEPEIDKDENHSQDNDKNDKNDHDIIDEEDISDKTIIEKAKSDSLRSYLFKQSYNELKKSPIIGTGLVYFDVDTDYGVSLQSAHNFILEYLNAYGIIGLLLMMYIHYTIISYFNIKNIKVLFTLLFTCGVILLQSLVEPTMLIVPVITLYMIIYSLFMNWEINDE